MSWYEIGPLEPMQDNVAYFAALSALLPVLAIAGAVELRILVRRLSRLGVDLNRPEGLHGWFVAVYVRLLAASLFGAVLLALSAVSALKPGADGLGWPWSETVVAWVVGLAAVLLSLPLLAAIFSPGDLTRWYGTGEDESEQ